jgi:hypothetical protein
MLKLAQRMTDNFCAGVCASTVHKWNKLNAGNVDEDVRVMTRKSVDDPGEPPCIVLSATTSVWLPISLRDCLIFYAMSGSEVSGTYYPTAQKRVGHIIQREGGVCMGVG